MYVIYIFIIKKGVLVLFYLLYLLLVDIEVIEWGFDMAKLSIVLKISNFNEFLIYISEIGYCLDFVG